MILLARHQGLGLECALREVFNADLLQVWDLAASLPHRDRWLLHAQGVGQCHLRAKVLDCLFDFHVCECGWLKAFGWEYKLCD